MVPNAGPSATPIRARASSGKREKPPRRGCVSVGGELRSIVAAHPRRVVTQTGFVPGNDLEAAFLGDFPPGQYTATISGKDGGTGVGLIEVFKLPDS